MPWIAEQIAKEWKVVVGTRGRVGRAAVHVLPDGVGHESMGLVRREIEMKRSRKVPKYHGMILGGNLGKIWE